MLDGTGAVTSRYAPPPDFVPDLKREEVYLISLLGSLADSLAQASEVASSGTPRGARSMLHARLASLTPSE